MEALDDNIKLSLHDKTYLYISFIVAIIVSLVYFLINILLGKSNSITHISINLFILFLFLFSSKYLSNFLLYYN